MKNIIYLSAIVACVALIVFGVIQKNGKETDTAEITAPNVQTPAVQTAAQKAATAASLASDSAPIVSSTPISAGTAHFRPDQPVTPGVAVSAPVDAEQAFIITPEIIAKKHLVDKYKIGICFGTARTVSDIAVKSLAAANPPFSAYLRQAYGLKTDLEVYNKIKQFQTITLTETASSVYKYVFSDGQCQTVIYYEGTVTVSGASATDTVSIQQSHTY